MVKEIRLTQGKRAIIDKEDYKKVIKYKWRAYKSRTKYKETFYAMTDAKQSNGKYKTLYLHRLIMDAPKGYVVDHLNRDGLDNRKLNLKVVTQKENAIRSVKFEDNEPAYMNSSKSKTTISFHIEKSKNQILDRLSKEMDISKASIIREAIDFYIKNKYQEYYENKSISQQKVFENNL